MTTHLLVPKDVDPVTILQTSMLGWNFSGQTFQDVYQGFIIVSWRGWRPTLTINDAQPVKFPTPPFFQVEFKRPGFDTITVYDTDWFGFDGHSLRRLTLADTDSYDISQWNGPAALGGTGTAQPPAA